MKLGAWEANSVVHTDALTLLKGLPDESVNCIVTSPPYFGLRSYTDGDEREIGKEETPEQYVENLVSVFREARRVLRSDGTFFLNLGDSYWGSRQGYGDTKTTNKEHRGSKQRRKPNWKHASAQHEAAYGTSDKEPANCQERGCLCGNLCDVCREGYRNRKSRTCTALVPTLVASLSESNRANTGFGNDRLPTLDLFHQAVRILDAIQDRGQNYFRDAGLLRAFQVSMSGVFSQQLLDECWQRPNRGECLLCGHSLTVDAQVSARKWVDLREQQQHNRGNGRRDDQPDYRSQCTDMVCEYCAEIAYVPPYIQPYCTSQPYKPKDLLMIPARVALALQADGWLLRSEVIWAKPNPMPESVTDRPTKSHEKVYLLVKSGRYYYDAEAIKEDAVNGDPTSPRGSTGVLGQQNAGRRNKQSDLGKRTYTGFNACWDARTEPLTKRNKRDVWTIPTQPFPGAHFAVMPEKLARTCILAGCPEGGIVLDPFMGSGTVARVARKHERQWIGSEINPLYVEMAQQSLSQMSIYEYQLEATP